MDKQTILIVDDNADTRLLLSARLRANHYHTVFAADALQAVCGQGTLLSEATNDTPAIKEARQRWQARIQREIGVACDHLRDAANALGRNPPC